MKNVEEQAYHSIVQQWKGGEHRLAGARASELVYQGNNEPNEKILDRLMKDAEGIERYISAPASGVVVETVPEQSGQPLARQPENRQNATGEPNQSSEPEKAKQDRIDKTLEPGRKARAKASDGEPNEIGSTKLNP